MAGSIAKRIGKDGAVSYRVRVEIPTGVEGQRKQSSRTFRSKKEAEKALAAWLVEIDRGTAVDPSKATVGDILRRWLDVEAAHSVQATTLEDYKSTIENHLIPGLGAVAIQRLQSSQVQTFYSEMRNAGTGARTVQLCHIRLRQALGWAMRMSIVSRNVAADVKPPTVERKEHSIWTPHQAQRFLATASELAGNDYVGNTWAALFNLLLATGLRRGEALGLSWNDIDLDAGTLRVSRSVTTLYGAAHVKSPKTAESRRTVPLPAGTVAMLRKQKSRQNAHRELLLPMKVWNEQGIVFANGFGGFLHPSTVDRAFQRIVKASGVERIRVHDLRHSFATWALSAGEPVTDVSRILGHRRVSITLDIYSHVIPNSHQRVSATIGNLLYSVPA